MTNSAVPTNSQSTVIPWQDWAEQAIVHLTPMIEMAAEGGANFAFASMPMGSIISELIGPTVIKQTVDAALAQLEGFLSSQSGVSVSASDTIGTIVANTINSTAPALAAQLGDKLIPMIQTEVAKALPVALQGANAPTFKPGAKPRSFSLLT